MSRYQILFLLSLLVIAGCKSGCRSDVAEVTGPEPLPPPPYELEPLVSFIAAPLEIPIVELDSLLNLLVPDSLVALRDHQVKKGIARAKIDLDVVKSRAINAHTRDGKIYINLPLRAEGRAKSAGLRAPFSAEILLQAVSEVILDSTWTTVAETKGSFSWEQDPTIKVLGINFSLKNAAEKALTRELEKITPRLDSLVADKVNIRRIVERLWEKIEEPIGISQEPPIWLTVRPESVYFAPAISRNDTLVFGAGLDVYVETSIGEKPVPIPLGELPPLNFVPLGLIQDTTYRFQVALPATISYSDANEMIDEALTGKGFDVKEGINLQFEDVEVYGHHESLVARVDVEADISDSFFTAGGRVFLVGDPIFDHATQVVRVDSFKYDINSESMMVRAADRMFREDLLTLVRERLAFPLSGSLEKAQAALETALQKQVIGKHLVLEGTITTLDPGDLYLTHDGILVTAHARGHVTLRLQALKEVLKKRPKSPALSTGNASGNTE